ncbi:MAG: hypothetical protein HQ559_04485 [Lentisphaerae bacterium]|nr:hypothetical protein [Lentisphaerota bacterium]
MKEPAHRIKRKNIYSYPRFQSKIVLIFGLLAVVYAGTNYVVSKTALGRVSDQIRQLTIDPANSADIRMILREEGMTLDIQLMLLTFLSFFILVMSGVLLSHILGGPINRVNNYVKNITNGTTKPQRISFRKYDFFHDFAKNFNRFQEHIGMLPKEQEEPGGDPGTSEPQS